jgi:hypothetical protein
MDQTPIVSPPREADAPLEARIGRAAETRSHPMSTPETTANTISTPSRRRRRLAAAASLVAGLGLVAVLAPPAGAYTDATSGHFRIDTDSVTSTVAHVGSTTTRVAHFLDDSRIRTQVGGTVTRAADGPPCVFVRATFTYDGGSTSTAESRRACAGEATTADVDLRSRTDRDTVRVNVQLVSAVDSRSAGITRTTDIQFVGDVPDSTGTADRLDVDAASVGVVALRGFTTVFTGSGQWSIVTRDFGPAGSFRAAGVRLTGSVQFRDAVPGTSVRLRATYVYDNGASTTTTLATAVRGGGAVSINTLGPVAPIAVRSVMLQLEAMSGSTSLGRVGTAPTIHLGDG